MTKKSNKRALLMSVLSLLLCCAMLVGSTFAWFTDTAKTGTVQITAGNLDVDIVKEDGTSLAKTAGKDTELFREMTDFLWEPGAMWVSSTFKVANKGNLALWYALSLEVQDAKADEKNLLDVIQWKIVKSEEHPTVGLEGTDHTARQAYWDGLTEKAGRAITDTLNGTTSDPVTSGSYMIVLYWEPGENDNQYNSASDEYVNKDKNPLSATFTLNVFATQAPVESDDFGNKYDDAAHAGKFYDAMNDAVTSAAAGLKAQDVDITLTITDDGAELGVKPGNSGDINTAYGAVKDAIAEALANDKDEIKTVNIGGHAVTISDDATKDTLAPQLETALMNYLSDEYDLGSSSVDSETLKKFVQAIGDTNSIEIPVNVVDNNDNSYFYNVKINLEAYSELFQRLLESMGG